ncbi:unnamed protein product [Lepeophtheirus salmonis]|uniref:(salmon louse) hypothetical protein n=1 Tax=Lepeophtheirus salmonis TaxID=72036 RepID=A0A7R8CHD2_LEPSM|nr:unnamed protein product [Lepeophtheirus salmonis]CAF2823444.1 unnamed protein product [Lepeophtheirus salmonis]
MPKDFKTKFPATRIVLDTTDIVIEKPKNVIQQVASWSSYKNCNTVKVIIGILPHGAVAFVSDAYGGFASDKQVIERYALMKNELFLQKRFDYGRQRTSCSRLVCSKGPVPLPVKKIVELDGLEVLLKLKALENKLKLQFLSKDCSKFTSSCFRSEVRAFRRFNSERRHNLGIVLSNKRSRRASIFKLFELQHVEEVSEWIPFSREGSLKKPCCPKITITTVPTIDQSSLEFLYPLDSSSSEPFSASRVSSEDLHRRFSLTDVVIHVSSNGNYAYDVVDSKEGHYSSSSPSSNVKKTTIVL